MALNYEDHKNRQQSLLEAIKLDLDWNLDRSKANIEEIEKGIIYDRSSIKVPNILSIGYWDLIKFNYPYLPKKLSEKDIFKKIRITALLTQQINETVSSRENYLISNEGNLAKYNEWLAHLNNELISKIEELKLIIYK